MNILDSIGKPTASPCIVTITGDAGIGKTSLAATFPKPIFIRAEDGMESINKDKMPDAFPVLKSVDDLWEQLTGLIKHPHTYKTLVIDSATQLETMFGDAVIEADPKSPKSLAQANGGYGAGFLAVAAMHHRLRKAAQVLKERKGMNVVFIAHSDVTTIELPDEDPYTRYELRLNKKCVSPYVDNVDMVVYMKLETFTTGDGQRKKAISDGTRLAICTTGAAQVSKNRYGIEEPLVVKKGENPFVGYIPSITRKRRSPNKEHKEQPMQETENDE